MGDPSPAVASQASGTVPLRDDSSSEAVTQIGGIDIAEHRCCRSTGSATMNLDHGRGHRVQCGHCVQMDDWQEQGSCYQKVG